MKANAVELTIFIILFALVAVMGFLASRWKRGDTMNHLNEWGLGGRRFGTWVSWFLIGGDLYTAYTFIAVPALMFGSGAIGFYAVPYTVVLYPLVFLPLVRLWSVSHRHGFVTTADFVKARFGSRTLGVLVSLTGIVATMPYVALQMVGVQACLIVMGVKGDWPLVIAFVVLALYTFSSGLRAPALIAFVKDSLIYIVIIVAVIVIPIKLGGFDHIFSGAAQALSKKTPPGSLLLGSNSQIQYITLALGSALALMLYPHSATGVLAAKSRGVVKRNMALLPAYSLMLGFLSLLGFMALAAGTSPVAKNSNTIVPALLDSKFPSWFSGIAFGAIGIGALVPAAIMSIAAANTFTRNIYKDLFRPKASPKEETLVAKIVSLIVKLGALAFILWLNPSFSIQLQLIGGVVIIQTLPSVAIGVFSRWFDRWALIAGWVVGMGWSVYMLYTTSNATTAHFASSSYPLSEFGFDTKATIWTGIPALLANLVVAVVVTAVLRALRVKPGPDLTTDDDYFAEAGDPGVAELQMEPGAGGKSSYSDDDPSPATPVTT